MNALVPALVLTLALGACGGRSSRAAPNAASAERRLVSSSPTGVQREIDQLLSDIRAKERQLDPERVEVTTDSAAEPAPMPETMAAESGGDNDSAGAEAPSGMSQQEKDRTRDIKATCEASETPRCQDVCTLRDSICESAARICELAEENDDEWAWRRCADGKRSCQRADQRCCGCT